MKKKNKYLINTLLIFLMGLSPVAYSGNKYVNVLTWWGYLDSPWISGMVKRNCGVTLSYDSYNSNPELIRRWSEGKTKYDVIIFSYEVYPAIKDEIALRHSRLYKNSNNYNPIIREHYLKSHFSHNIAYFQHTFTGFIWNPRQIDLTEKDTILSAFKKAKSNMVIIIDDPVEVEMLLALSSDRYNNEEELSFINFKNMTQKTKAYISNQLNQIYNHENFAFAYQWSGIALAELKLRKSYKFLVNKNLSYISTDLIAQVKDSKNSACVADLFSSEQFLSRLQDESYYFSPYGDVDHLPNNEFKAIYQDFFKNLPQLSWIKPHDKDSLNALNHNWDIIKYELTK